MTDSIAFGGLGHKRQRYSIPTPATPPTTFAEMFDVDLAHLWDSYTAPTWTDSVGGLHGGVGAFGIPAQATQNGHTHPVFVDANNDGMITASSSILSGLSSWTFFYAFKGLNFYRSIITKASGFYVEYTGGFITPKAAYFNYSSGADLLGTTTQMNDNVWHRVIITANGNAGKLYVDGNLEASATVGTIPVANAPVYLGTAPGVPGSVDGSILVIGVATRGIGAQEAGYLDDILANWVGA